MTSDIPSLKNMTYDVLCQWLPRECIEQLELRLAVHYRMRLARQTERYLLLQVQLHKYSRRIQQLMNTLDSAYQNLWQYEDDSNVDLNEMAETMIPVHDNGDEVDVLVLDTLLETQYNEYRLKRYEKGRPSDHYYRFMGTIPVSNMQRPSLPLNVIYQNTIETCIARLSIELENFDENLSMHTH